MRSEDLAREQHHAGAVGDDLWKRTFRTVAVLVGACVLFVGTLSLVAVVVTNKAVGSDVKTAAEPYDATAKKPLSI